MLASAFVAFHGWPQVADQPSPASIVLTQSRAVGPSASGRRLSALIGGAGIRGALRAGHGSSLGTAGRRAAGAPGVGLAQGASQASGRSDGGSARAACTGCETPGGVASSDPAQAAVGALANTIANTATSVGSTQDGAVGPDAGGAIDAAGSAAGGAVSSVGHAVGGH